MWLFILRFLSANVVSGISQVHLSMPTNIVTRHGPLDKCPIAQYEEIALKYLGAEEGSPERIALEQRFGRANIRRLVATYEEEKANLQWLEQSTMMCPGCRCHVEKTLGCNHVSH